MMSGTPIAGQQGSFTALSLLAANPEVQLIAAAVVGGVTLTVGAATFIYKEIKDYEEKKHLDEIKAINKLHELYLSKIFVPGKNETLSLPAIFKMKSEKDFNSVESLHLNDDIIRSIGNRLPRGTDIALTTYQEAVLNAILKLKEYYFSRKDRTDINSRVITYLLVMLDSHCLKFEGYDYDIAYLGALASFINAYASMDRHVNTKKFSHLDEVYSHMVTGQHLLDLHKDVLSLSEIMSDLYDSCRYLGDQSLRFFSMIINPKDNWNLLETVTKDELSQGMLKKYFVAHDLFGGLITIPDNEIDVLPSPFKDCLMKLTEYAKKSLDPDITLSAVDVPGINIVVPDLKRYLELKNKQTEAKVKLTPDEKAEKKKIKNQLEELKTVFYKCENFVTTELDPKTRKSKHKFIAITDYSELVNRVGVIVDFANLIREIISLQYYSMNLIKGIKLLGEIDVTSPHHTKVFKVMDELCGKIQNDYLKLKKDFFKIQEANNAMQLKELTNHRDNIYALLEATNTNIGNARTAINAYWNKNRKITKQRKITAEHNLFEAADLIGKVHALPFTQPVKHKKNSKSSKTDKSKKKISHRSSSKQNVITLGVPDVSGEKEKKVVNPPVNVDSNPKSSNDHLKAKDSNLVLVQTVATSEPKPQDPVELQPIKSSSTPARVDNKVQDSSKVIKMEDINDIILIHASKSPDENISTKLNTIQKVITNIRKEESPSETDASGRKAFDSEINAYMDLYTSLVSTHQKIITMANAAYKTTERNAKIDHMMNVLTAITENVYVFVQMRRRDRFDKVSELEQLIQKEVSNPGHAVFIDGHDNEFWKLANSVCGAGFFKTDSRGKLSSISLACHNLTQILTEGRNHTAIESMTSNSGHDI